MGETERTTITLPDWKEISEEPVWERRRPARAGASIILVNYNGGQQVLECLRSLQAEREEGREIIVVDNASLDGSPRRIQEAFPHVKLIRSAANLGFGGGSNLGARYAGGHYLAFLNPDTLVEPGWLEALRRALEANPETGMATACILLRGRQGVINTCGNDVHLSGLTLCRGMGQPRQAYASPAEVGAVSGAAFLVRRELFEELGGFDASFFLYMEDTDLSLRVRLAGWRIVYVPQAVVHHDYRLRFGPRKTYYLERNRYRMLLKVFRWRTLLALLPALLLAEAVTWGFVLCREPQRLGNKLYAYANILQDWAALKRARASTQEKRQVKDCDLLKNSVFQLAFEQTGDCCAARLAHRVFDPLFHACQGLAMSIVNW
jgi:GT2 family glycosyltransferase